MESLPHVDEHTVAVAARPEAVRAAARATFDRPLTGATAWYARLVGVKGGRAFHVDSEAPEVLALVGEHRFSRYALTLAFRPSAGGGTDLTARTDAAFPGLGGRLYRAAVISSGAHRVLTRALLRRIGRRAADDR